MRLTRLMIVAYVSGHAGMVGFVAPLTTVLADCNDPYIASGSCDERLPLHLLRERLDCHSAALNLQLKITSK